MAVRMIPQGTSLYAFLEGEIDHHSAAFLRTAIDEALVQSCPLELVLDFSGVTFMDSSGIGLIMGRFRAAKAQNCNVRVMNVKERDLRLMKMSGLAKIVEFGVCV